MRIFLVWLKQKLIFYIYSNDYFNISVIFSYKFIHVHCVIFKLYQIYYIKIILKVLTTVIKKQV